MSQSQSIKIKKRRRPSMESILLWFSIGCLAILIQCIPKVLPDHDFITDSNFSLLLFWACALVAVIDFYLLGKLPIITVERELATSLALNQWAMVHLKVNHDFQSQQNIEIYDGVNSQTVADGEHNKVILEPGQFTKINYRIRPLERGPFSIDSCHVRHHSPLGLWTVQYELPTQSNSKVYPDFAAIAKYTILAADNHTSAMGIRTHNRRGQGMAFHQLREYRQGDSLRQVDWKATARRHSLTSKEYQDERDQNLVLLIDSGRRMRSKDDDLNHFDHTLNASILVSYIALRQGDSVGVMTFGSSERWLPPQKGSDRVKVILNGLYDIQTGNTAPDYLSAAEKLSKRQGKRSLVVLITNCRDEETQELNMAVGLLKKNHLVLVANIREAIIDNIIHKPIETFEDATSYIGTAEFQKRRALVHQQFQSNGVYAIDCLANELAVSLANTYWAIKRSGVL